MKLFLAIGLILTQAAFAGTFSNLKMDTLLDEYSRAEHYVEKVKIKEVNWGKVINELKKFHSGCGEVALSVSRTNAISHLKKYFEEDYKLALALEKLNKQGKIVKAIVASDGSEGDSEYCSQTSFQFYSKDGELLSILYDFNT